MAIDEMARRLFKPGYADIKEYKQALRAVKKLSEKEWQKLCQAWLTVE